MTSLPVPIESQAHLFSRTLIFLDLETTGLSPEKGAEIVEIGAIKVDGWDVIGTFQTLVRPTKRIPADATKIHGITDEVVILAPRIETALATLRHFVFDSDPVVSLSQPTILAHNAEFDRRFLRHFWDKTKFPITGDMIDTLEFARKHRPKWSSHSLNSLRGRYRVLTDNPHRALEDVRDLHTIFMAMVEERWGPEIPTMDEFRGFVEG